MRRINNIIVDDILDLFLIFKSKESILAEFDTDVLMKSFAKHSSLEKFDSLFKNISVEIDENGNEFIDLTKSLEKAREEKLIIGISIDKNKRYILGSQEDFEIMKSSYSLNVLNIFKDLMFYVNNDLEFGIDNWKVAFEDEVIDVPGYSNFVTGEFICEDKNNIFVKKKMKQRAISNLKNIYK